MIPAYTKRDLAHVMAGAHQAVADRITTAMERLRPKMAAACLHGRSEFARERICWEVLRDVLDYWPGSPEPLLSSVLNRAVRSRIRAVVEARKAIQHLMEGPEKFTDEDIVRAVMKALFNPCD